MKRAASGSRLSQGQSELAAGPHIQGAHGQLRQPCHRLGRPTASSGAKLELVHRLLPADPDAAVLGGDRGWLPCWSACWCSGARAARPCAHCRSWRLIARARQSDLAAGGAREPLQHRHRGDGRLDQPDHCRPPGADRRHPRAISRPSSAKSPISRSMVRAARPTGDGPSRHQPVRRSQPSLGERAAGPPGRRHHGHRRAGARRTDDGGQRSASTRLCTRC